MINASEVVKLRQETGQGVMACKKALTEAKGDYDKAKQHLMKRSKGKSAEKAERDIKAGIIDTYTHHGGNVGVLLKLGCETDFVAKNDDFKNLAHEISLQIASMNPKNVDELLGQEYFKNPKQTIKDLIDEAVGKIGENIQVAEFVRYEL